MPISQHFHRARGMTLIELMIVIGMLAILAALVIPMFGTTSDMARIEAMATNAAQIRGLIIHHAGAKDVPVSAGGYPNTIDAAWFKIGRMPDHSWTGDSLNIEIVSAASNIIYPASKTFDPAISGAINAWYNRTNGRFWVRVPAQTAGGATLQLFNSVNKCNANALGQTTE